MARASTKRVTKRKPLYRSITWHSWVELEAMSPGMTALVSVNGWKPAARPSIHQYIDGSVEVHLPLRDGPASCVRIISYSARELAE